MRFRGRKVYWVRLPHFHRHNRIRKPCRLLHGDAPFESTSVISETVFGELSSLTESLSQKGRKPHS